MDYELLFEISKIDSEIIKLQRSITLKEKKKKLDILRKEYNAIKKEYEEVSKECKDNTAAANRLTKELENMSTELEDKEQKLYTSSNMKTIEVYQNNVDKLKEDIKGSESLIYDLISKIQDYDLQKKGLFSASEEIKYEFNNLKTEFNDEKVAIAGKINKLNKKRNSLAEKVDKTNLSIYEEIKKEKGYGMAEVKGEICTGCGIGVPSIIINESAMEKKLVKCPNCNRLIYIDKLTK